MCWRRNGKTALVSGITRQDGSQLKEFLLGKGYKVHNLTRWWSDFASDPSARSKRRLYLKFSFGRSHNEFAGSLYGDVEKVLDAMFEPNTVHMGIGCSIEVFASSVHMGIGCTIEVPNGLPWSGSVWLRGES